MPGCQGHQPGSEKEREAHEGQSVFADRSFEPKGEQQREHRGKNQHQEKGRTWLVEQTQPKPHEKAVETIIPFFNGCLVKSHQVGQQVGTKDRKKSADAGPEIEKGDDEQNARKYPAVGKEYLGITVEHPAEEAGKNLPELMIVQS